MTVTGGEVEMTVERPVMEGSGPEEAMKVPPMARLSDLDGAATETILFAQRYPHVSFCQINVLGMFIGDHHRTRRSLVDSI